MHASRVAVPTLLFVVVAWAASSWGQGVPAKAPLGEAPPPVTGIGQWITPKKTPPPWARDGAIDFEALRGRVVVLEFWTTWCSGCRRIAPTLKKLAKEHFDSLVVVGVTIPDQRQDAAAIAAHVAEKKLRFPQAILASGETLRAYDVGKIPYALVVDRRGEVAWKGNPDTDKKAFKAAVREAVRETPAAPSPSAPTSRPAR